MANRRYQPLSFGFLNDAQDEVNLKDFEASSLESVDADRLALGELSVSSYFGQAAQVTPVYTETEVAKTSFRINDTTEEVEYLTVNDQWLSLKDEFGDASNNLGQAEVGLFDGIVGQVNVTDESGVAVSGAINVRNGAGGSISVTSGALVTWEITDYTPSVSLEYRYKYNEEAWQTATINAPLPTSIDWFTAGVAGTEFRLNFSSIQVGDTIVFSLGSGLFADGDYSYRVVEKAKTGSDDWLITSSALRSPSVTTKFG